MILNRTLCVYLVNAIDCALRERRSKSEVEVGNVVERKVSRQRARGVVRVSRHQVCHVLLEIELQVRDGYAFMAGVSIINFVISS